jgi:trk system potassium uptake protein TrkA
MMHNRRAVRILVIGAGQVGTTVIEALHREHAIAVVDMDAERLSTLAYRFDVMTIAGNGASRRILQDAGISTCDLLIACTSRDEVNIVASLLAKKLSSAQTIVRTTNVEYLDVWRERQLEVDFMVSSELETAHAIGRIIGIPAARQTDVFAEGQVLMVEFEVPLDAERGATIGQKLRDAVIPPDSKVASIVRGERMIVPRGDESVEPGDRLIVIGSPDSARAWGQILARGERRASDVVIVGAGDTGIAIARVLLEEGAQVRVVEENAARARWAAEELPEARVFNAPGTDAGFLERERIWTAHAAIFAMPSDSTNLYAATLAKLGGVGFTIAVVVEPVSVRVLERAGVDVAVNPRSVTAEEMTGSLIGAIVRDGKAVFPHGDDMLLGGDRAIIFTEAARVGTVERAL